jgi:uncharacterized protein (DUF2141 family)
MTAIVSLILFFNTHNDIKSTHYKNMRSKNTALVDVELTIKNIRNTNGTIRVGFFKDNASFDKETAFKSVPSTKETRSNGVLKVKTQLEPGIYGASLLDDENNNGKMDYNFIGVPKEGFGFSNYYHSGFTKPKFEAFKFEVKASNTPKIEMVIRYM